MQLRMKSAPPTNMGGLLRIAPQSSTDHQAILRAQISFLAHRSKLRFFEGLPESDRDAIVAAASYRRFSANSVVVHQGDPADRLFLLIKGTARLFFVTPDGRKVYLLWLTPGDVFGGASLLTQSATFLVNTEVSKESQALVWQHDVIRRLAAQFPRLLENGLSIAYDYLAWYVASHLSLVSHSARERLAHVLLTLSDGIGHKSPTGVQLDITNEQLANTANITLFTASRLLSEWQRSGAIAKSRGKIVIRHPERIFDATARSASVAGR